MKKTYFLSVLFMLGIVFSVNAQFTVNAEFRPRAEIRNGYKQLPDSGSVPAYVITQRTRLGAGYQWEWLRTYVSFQDVRVWGDESLFNSTGIHGDAASVEMNEGWVELSFLNNSSVKIGRQYFDYDDTRLLSTRNWGQNAISYDAILYRWVKENWSLDAAVSLNNKPDTAFGNAYPATKMKTLNFIHLSKKVNENLTINGIALASGYTPDNTSETIYLRGTYGFYANYRKKPVNLMSTFYYQNGRNNKGIKVDAWNFNLFGDYSFGKAGVCAGLSVYSGDQTSDSGEKDQLFDILYGNRHSYNGLMDNFNNLPRNTANGGLVDAFGSIYYKPGEKTKIQVDYHYFALQQSNVMISNEITNLDNALGSEVDLFFRTNFTKDIFLEGGYSFMLPTSTIETVQKIDEGKSEFSYWVWVMLTVKPEIFSTREKK